MRVTALSDVHTDHPDNLRWIEELSSSDYTEDHLILAGDVAHEDRILRRTFDLLLRKFARVCFVPGNHDLWVRESHHWNSLDRFVDVLQTCSEMGVSTAPIRVSGMQRKIWIVPLFSWYTRPEEGPDSLFLEKRGEDPTLKAWSDNYFIRWPELEGATNPTEHFLSLNQANIDRDYDAPVISFSHFLPRADLIRPTPEERAKTGSPSENRDKSFNFSRVAGSWSLDQQIRTLGSLIHVYGHQHRNRHRVLDDVRYVARCLGYPRERHNGDLPVMTDAVMVVWDSECPSDAR